MWKEQASALLLVCGILVPGGTGRAQPPPSQQQQSASGPNRSAPRWLRVGPAGEEFELSLPAMPQVSAESLRLEGGAVVVRYYLVSADGAHYAVLAAGVEGFPSEEVAYAMMLHLCHKLFPSPASTDDQGSGAAVQTELRRDLRLNGHAGREYAIRVRASTGLLRFYNTGRNYYAAVALADAESSPLVERFMDSFTLSAAPPAAAGRERARPLAAARRTGGSAPARSRPRPATGGRWLVILGSFAGHERAAAGRALARFRRAGLEARLVRTDDYPNLARGLLAVVMGPYTKPEAQGLLDRARPAASEAYIKSGW